MTRDLHVEIGDLDIHDIEWPYSIPVSALVNVANQTDWPFSSGQRRSFLDVIKTVNFRKVGTGPQLGSIREDLHRLERIGESLKLELYHLDESGDHRVIDWPSVVYVRKADLTKYGEESIRLNVILDESYRRIIDPCDQLQDIPRGSAWSVDNGGGAVSINTDFKKHGTGSVQLCGTIAGAAESRLRLNPPTYFDASAYKWVGFWYRTSNITDLDELRIRAYQSATDYMSYDFTHLVTDIDTWFFIRINRLDFTENGYFDWTDCRYFVWTEEHSSQQEYCFTVDEFCVIE